MWLPLDFYWPGSHIVIVKVLSRSRPATCRLWTNLWRRTTVRGQTAKKIVCWHVSFHSAFTFCLVRLRLDLSLPHSRGSQVSDLTPSHTALCWVFMRKIFACQCKSIFCRKKYRIKKSIDNICLREEKPARVLKDPNVPASAHVQLSSWITEAYHLRVVTASSSAPDKDSSVLAQPWTYLIHCCTH